MELITPPHLRLVLLDPTTHEELISHEVADWKEALDHTKDDPFGIWVIRYCLLVVFEHIMGGTASTPLEIQVYERAVALESRIVLCSFSLKGRKLNFPIQTGMLMLPNKQAIKREFANILQQINAIRNGVLDGISLTAGNVQALDTMFHIAEGTVDSVCSQIGV